MKQLTLALLMFGTMSFADDSIFVTNTKARDLYQALVSAGVSARVLVGANNVYVKSLQCEQAPKGFIWAQCDGFDQNARGHQIHPVGNLAFDIFTALHKAGVLAKRHGFGTDLRVSEVRCSHAIIRPNPEGRGFKCTIVK